jgi:hypothetical protein
VRLVAGEDWVWMALPDAANKLFKPCSSFLDVFVTASRDKATVSAQECTRKVRGCE